LEQTPRGYRTQARCSWVESKSSTVNSEEILALFGRDEEEVAESLDIRQLLSASPLQREARIAALLSTSGGGIEETRAEALERARAKGASASALDAAKLPLHERLRDEGLDGALAWANEEKRRYATDLLGKTHADREIEERLSDMPRVSADQIRDLEREAAELEARVLELRRHAQREEAARIDVLQAERQELEAREARREVEATATERSALRKELTEIDQTMDALIVPPHEDPEECAALFRQAQELEAQAQALGPIPDDAGDPTPQSPSSWTEVAAIAARLIDLSRQESSLAGYKVLTEAQRLERLSRAELRQGQAALQEERRRREYDRERRIRRDELLSRAARTKAEAQDLIQAARSAYVAAHGKAIQKHRALVSRRASIRQRIAQIESADRSTMLALERATVEHDLRKRHLDQLRVHAPAQADPARLADLRNEIDTLTQARAARQELERSMSERARVEESRAAYAALEWALQRIREERLDQAGGPLVQQMTRILRAGGRRETPFLEAGKGSCRIGWRTPAGYSVLIQTLSGGEWTLFASALAASLILLRGPALRFLFVEAGEADPDTLHSLLDGLRSVSESLTSVMVLTHHPNVTAKGWTILRHLPALQAESA